MVLTTKGEAIARISIVNYYGNTLYDKLIKPETSILDYRSTISGIKEGSLDNAPSIKQCREEIILLLKFIVVKNYKGKSNSWSYNR